MNHTPVISPEVSVVEIPTMQSLSLSHIGVPSSNQTWLAGKWTIEQCFCLQNLHSSGIFQPTMWLMTPEGIS